MINSVLITGGAGFIGSHLVDSFLSRGENVTVLDDFSTGVPRNLAHVVNNPRLQVINGSILNEQLVNDLVSSSTGCIHMAAAVGVRQILDRPVESLKTNLYGSENVLNAATAHGKKLLLASTSEIYGKNASEVLTEESDRILGSPLLTRWTYSEAKAIEEAIAHYLFRTRSLDVRIARLFNTVGPRQSAAYGMVIPRFFQAALEEKEIIIHGNGTQRRVFCHVADAVAGIISIWDSKSATGQAFNVGGIEEITILDLAKRIMNLVERQLPIRFITYEALRDSGFEDMQRRVPSTDKLKQATGWQPKLGISEILNDYLKFLRSQP